MSDTPTSIPFFEIIEDDLRRDDYCIGCLNRAFEDYDPRVVLSLIRDIAKARHIKMTDLAKRSGISRSLLYHVLSDKGNPTMATLFPIIKALGFTLKFDKAVAG